MMAIGRCTDEIVEATRGAKFTGFMMMRDSVKSMKADFESVSTKSVSSLIIEVDSLYNFSLLETGTMFAIEMVLTLF